MIQRLSFWIMMIVCSVMVSGQEYDGYYTNPILPSGADRHPVQPYRLDHQSDVLHAVVLASGAGWLRVRHDVHGDGSRLCLVYRQR